MVNRVRNFLIMLKNLQHMYLKLLQKTTEDTGDLIGYKIANTVPKSYDNRITKVSKNSQ